jgi:hypothetical protein
VLKKKGKPDTKWLNASPVVFFAKASRGEELTSALLKNFPMTISSVTNPLSTTGIRILS